MKKVMIRRGKKVNNNVPAQYVVAQIKKGDFKGSDEISAEGTKWIRLDQHPQLAKYFSGSTIEKEKRIKENGASGLVKGIYKVMAVAVVLCISYYLYQSQTENPEKTDQLAKTSTAYAGASKVSNKQT